MKNIDLFIIWLKKNTLGIKLNKPFIVKNDSLPEKFSCACLKLEKDEEGKDDIAFYLSYPDKEEEERYYRGNYAYELLGILIFNYHILNKNTGEVEYYYIDKKQPAPWRGFNNNYLIKLWMKRMYININELFNCSYKTAGYDEKIVCRVAFREEEGGFFYGTRYFDNIVHNCNLSDDILGLLIFSEDSEIISEPLIK